MPCRFNETHLGSRWWWKTVLYFFLAIQIASYLGCDIACIAICICLKVFAASSKCTCQYLESKEYATQHCVIVSKEESQEVEKSNEACAWKVKCTEIISGGYALWDEDDDGDGEDEVEAKISENKKKFKWKMLVKFKIRDHFVYTYGIFFPPQN
ncbi:hypothetical protein AB3S75_042288 [Citrus x aurantiifolia]